MILHSLFSLRGDDDDGYANVGRKDDIAPEHPRRRIGRHRRPRQGRHRTARRVLPHAGKNPRRTWQVTYAAPRRLNDAVLGIWRCPHRVLIEIATPPVDAFSPRLLSQIYDISNSNLHAVDTLGYFSLFQNLSYALAIPFWAWLVHRHKVQNAHNILSLSCFVWGIATLQIARSETIPSQAFFRCLNGGALASILPLSQMMLVDLVPTSMRGSAFGLMGLLERVAAMIATSAVVWYDDWRIPYSVVGSISMLMAFGAKRYLRMTTRIEDEKHRGEELSMMGIVKRVSREPSFVYLIAQGVFGAIPWNMMSFVVLLLKWKGFTKEQIISFQVSGGIIGSLGVFLGGVSGDYFSHLPRGRVGVALFSVVSESLFYSLFLYSEKYHFCLIWKSLFHLTGGWATAAAIRSVSSCRWHLRWPSCF